MKAAIKHLQIAKEESKAVGEHLNKKGNIWTHRFYTLLSKKGFPLMNRSSVAIRNAKNE
jgi:hypothetical protein